MTEAQVRQKIVGIMQGWIGLHEGDGSHMKILIIYNSHTPLARGYRMTKTDPWCAATVSAAAIEAGYTDIIPTDCSCSAMIAKLKDMRIWQENDAHVPAPGDLIFYDWQDSGKGDNTGAPDHVGMVEKVSGKTITVIEGNYHDSVKRRTIQVDSKYIRGYGVPDYADKAKAVTEAEAATEIQKPAAVTTTSKSIFLIAQEILDGVWGNGDERKTRLKEAGYNPAQSQATANALSNGTLRVSVTPAVLNVRRGPGTDYDIVGKLLYGTTVAITQIQTGEGSDAGWGKMYSGWIALDHVRAL